jgi:hypothetical protein
MKREGRGVSALPLTYIDSPASDQCSCLPLSSLHKASWNEEEVAEGSRLVTPVTQELNSQLRDVLSDYFPRSAPLSVLILHISQLEHIHIAPKSAVLHKRHRYHAPASFLDQVLINVRRTIRGSDQILVHDGAGIALILPDVDQEGAHNVLERVYYSINLLQSETVIPPLKRETDIVMGIGSYPEPGSSLEDMLYHTGFVTHRLTLRPAVATQLRSTRSTTLPEGIAPGQYQDHDDHLLLAIARSNGIPFMQLPAQLPVRLKQLIPYDLALELRCAPVGRDHNRLTVAMAHPTDTAAILRLREMTSMTIFPVSCDVKALDELLTNGW